MPSHFLRDSHPAAPQRSAKQAKDNRVIEGYRGGIASLVSGGCSTDWKLGYLMTSFVVERGESQGTGDGIIATSEVRYCHCLRHSLNLAVAQALVEYTPFILTIFTISLIF
jgi:hypothetical protein